MDQIAAIETDYNLLPNTVSFYRDGVVNQINKEGLVDFCFHVRQSPIIQHLPGELYGIIKNYSANLSKLNELKDELEKMRDDAFAPFESFSKTVNVDYEVGKITTALKPYVGKLDMADDHSKRMFGIDATYSVLKNFGITTHWRVDFTYDPDKSYGSADNKVVTLNLVINKTKEDYVDTVAHELDHVVEDEGKSALPDSLIDYNDKKRFKGSTKNYQTSSREIHVRRVAKMVVDNLLKGAGNE